MFLRPFVRNVFALLNHLAAQGPRHQMRTPLLKNTPLQELKSIQFIDIAPKSRVDRLRLSVFKQMLGESGGDLFDVVCIPECNWLNSSLPL